MLLGLGDDCAAVCLSGTTLLTTDALIEEVHFRRSWTSLRTLGHKAFAVNASDIASMGGVPTFALLSLGLPAEFLVEELNEFFDGFVAEASVYGAVLVGGNMSAAPCLMISVTLLGKAPYGVVSRGGMRVGEGLYVTGTLGDAALGLRLLQQGEKSGSAVERFLRPSARLQAGQLLARRKLVGGMIDVSDGLLQDLGHLCAESHVGAVVEGHRLPLSQACTDPSTKLRAGLVAGRDWELALSGGEDYELLFSAPMGRVRSLQRVTRESGCPITCIGRVVEKDKGIVVVDEAGRRCKIKGKGYDHFSP
ncbi:MAG: thiamine-phosphate kinase [Deltaproteobacteria bacterium]|nr:thiamine-phosphate kinase [Deltaproteobacteria bacterium]